jgi:hypothetical protein
MNPKQKLYILQGLLALGVVVFFGIAIVGLSTLSSKSKSLSDLRLQSRLVDDQLASLTQAKAEISKYAYFKDVAKTVIPSDKDQAQAVVDIFKLADESGISLQNIAFPASTLGLSGSSSTTSSSSVSNAKSILSQAKAVPDIPGLYSIELIITPETGNQVAAGKLATYDKLLDFLSRIEHNRRTAQIASVNIEPITSSQNIHFTLTINIFIKP